MAGSPDIRGVIKQNERKLIGYDNYRIKSEALIKANRLWKWWTWSINQK